MEKFISHTGTGVPLRRSNVDTDQIIPAVYLKRVTRSGFEDGLYLRPTAVLRRPAARCGRGRVDGAPARGGGRPVRGRRGAGPGAGHRPG